MTIKHKNGVKTKMLSDSDKQYLIANANKYSCVVLADRVGVSRHMVQKFITEQGLDIKIRKPRKTAAVASGSEDVYFDPFAQEWY